MSAAAHDPDELRELVRDVLREVVPAVVARSPNGSGPAPAEPVSLRTDADLACFVQRVLRLAEDPLIRAELRDGRRAFRLAPAAGANQPGTREAADVPQAPVRIPAGAVTERRIAEVAAGGARSVLLEPGAVLTPLAREKARALGLVVTRRS